MNALVKGCYQISLKLPLQGGSMEQDVSLVITGEIKTITLQGRNTLDQIVAGNFGKLGAGCNPKSVQYRERLLRGKRLNVLKEHSYTLV